MRRFGVVVALLAIAAAATIGCDRGQATIPPGAQIVHVTVDGSEVRLDPAVVRQGEVYFMLDTRGASVGLAKRQRAAEELPGPMSDDDLARLARGDTEGTSIGGFADIGCSAEQRAADRGLMGYCGNVFKDVLAPGKYGLFDGSGGGEGPQVVTVLEVSP